MSLVALMVVGLVAGFILSRIVNRSGVVLDIFLGLVGALISGWLFTMFGKVGVTTLDRYTLLVVVGAALLLVAVIGTALLLATYRRWRTTTARRQPGRRQGAR